MIPKDKNLKKFAILACIQLGGYPTDGSTFPYIGNLLKDDTIESVLDRLRNKAFQEGEINGQLRKISEIKNALNIEIDD